MRNGSVVLVASLCVYSLYTTYSRCLFASMLVLEQGLEVLLLLEHIVYREYSVLCRQHGREERFCCSNAVLRQSHGMYATVHHTDQMLSACRYVDLVMSVLVPVKLIGSLLVTPCAFLAA